MNKELKRHIASFVTTFLSAFLISVGATIQTFDLETLTVGIVLGVVLAAARTALKVTIEKGFGLKI